MEAAGTELGPHAKLPGLMIGKFTAGENGFQKRGKDAVILVEVATYSVAFRFARPYDEENCWRDSCQVIGGKA
jgi:hypothetical protein